MDNLINTSRHGKGRNSSGNARAAIPGHVIKAHGPQGKTATVGGCLNRKGKPASSPTKGNSTKRYFKQFSYKPNGPETGTACSANSCFQSFKNRFSANSRAGNFGRPFKAFSAKLTTNYGGSRDFRRGTGLLTRVSCTTKSRTHPTPLQFSHVESEKIDSEVATLLEKGALNMVKPVSGQVLSSLFWCPNGTGNLAQ